MERLIQKSDRKIQQVSGKIKRYLYHELTHKERITIIKGARGVGKTTLLLQYGQQVASSGIKVLYVALDDLFFQENSLYELADDFTKHAGTLLLLDEVHKYPNWSQELKLIYDDLPDLHLIVTSSSLLEIFKSESDLSRRAVTHTLKELSFREFIIFEKKIVFPSYPLEAILQGHKQISYSITEQIKPLYEFAKYLKVGMLPFYWENPESYLDKLLQIINLTLEVDLMAVESMDYNHVAKLKKLIYAISTSAPFKPNISKLSERIGMSRQALIKALHYLERARMIFMLNRVGKGISVLSKPDKLFLNNPNYLQALNQIHENRGSVRESFFINQLDGLHTIDLPKTGDFLINQKYKFEVGGKNKKQRQITEVGNAYVVKDDIENGYDQVIPLWLFGFMY